MNADLQAVPGEDALSAQLFRYAQDLDTLMQQHNRLQKHHQMLLQSLGQEVPSDNLLPNLLARTSPLHWITDQQGNILRTNSDKPRSRRLGTGMQTGKNIRQYLAEQDSPVVEHVLARLGLADAHSSAVQMQVQWVAGDSAQKILLLDALLMPVIQDGQLEIHWYLQPATQGDYTPLQAQTAFVHRVKSEHGALVVSPEGNVVAANGGFCRISGYSEVELVGRNTNMLGSGRHDASFFQDFWLELMDTGSWNGTLFNRRKSGQIFLGWKTIRMIEDPQGQVLSYMEGNVDISYGEPSVKQMEAIANTDSLTGLPNRRMLMERFKHYLADADLFQDEIALLFIDLDRFKPINDELGHAVGDLVLQEVANRMGKALLPEDLLARAGGDEFVVVLRGRKRVEMAEAIGSQIQNALAQGLQIQGRHLGIGASIGCARYPLDGNDMLTLLQRADAAMYGAKRFGLPFCFYDEGMDEADQPNLELDLWQAVDRGEITLVYQPQIRNDKARSLRGCEALMRWKHPVLGDVDTAQFIALAEKSGAIVHLGCWALEHACSQMRLWREQGLPEFTLSLNVSLRQLRSPLFLGEVLRALQDNGLSAQQLEMELSETQALMCVPGDIQHIQALREIGVRIAIDDYGISFSSLSRLNCLSISSFKINAQCVRDLSTSADARAISNCMIAISKAMGIEVIAQGVETEEQAALLAQQGCQVIQGFYSGHPVGAEALVELARAG
ncbi:GGDEF domain-containing protein [Rhodoferax lacus]|uniref:GGDEF domain-containing protein n=1 Tax=Rhodoferax lacus TaxID=2184758 RepID=A0A3E1RFK2_9BURK|nr:EAL domain-containing protein [Rhodoferax lacus]RFO98149.1 GGDEF domain-containing protein [Rhodoferax lacus]